MEDASVKIDPNLSQEDQQFVVDALEIGFAMQPRFSAAPAFAKGNPTFKPATVEVTQQGDAALTAVMERARQRKIVKKET